MNRYTPNELVAGIRKRDNAVLSYIYKSFYQAVLHFVMNNNGTSDDAKDVFQEAMIVVFENIRADRDFKLSSSLQTYIFSISRIIWIKHLTNLKKGLGKLNENHEFIEFEEPQPFKEHDFRYSLYQKVFLKLPVDCQKIMKMVSEGVSQREIAEKLGYKSESYIAKRKHFCKEYLIKLIKEDPDYHSDKM